MEDDDAIIARLGKKLGSKKRKLAKELAKDGFGDDFFDAFPDETPEKTTEKPPEKKRDLTEQRDLYGQQGKWVPKRLLPQDQQENRALTGILNRVSDATLESCAASIVRCYAASPAAHVNRAVTDRILEACVTRAKRSDDALAPTYAALATAVHFAGGRELGCLLLEELAARRDERACMFIGQLCAMELAAPCLALSMAEAFADEDLERAVMIVKACADRVRGEDTVRLRRLRRTTPASDSRTEHARLELMELCKKRTRADERLSRLRASVRRLAPVAPLKVEWNDLLSQRGKWWRVGARYDDAAPTQSATPLGKGATTPGLQAAFAALVSSQSVDDALVHVADAKPKDVAAAAVKACAAEKAYNSFYAAFLTKWLDRKRSFALKLAFWDALKVLKEPRPAANLGKLLGAVLDPSSLDALKVIDPRAALAHLPTQTLLTMTLRGLLLRDDDLTTVKSRPPDALLAFLANANLAPPSKLPPHEQARFTRRKAAFHQALLDVEDAPPPIENRQQQDDDDDFAFGV